METVHVSAIPCHWSWMRMGMGISGFPVIVLCVVGGVGCGSEDKGGTPANPSSGGASGCTVADNGDGSYDLTCGDGTEVTVQNGVDGTPQGCTVAANGDGTYQLTCADGTEATLSDGIAAAAEGCSITDNGDGTYRLSCDDGSEVTVADGRPGPATTCSALDNGDGSYTMTCSDGTVVTLHDGQDGGCVAAPNGDGTATLTCPDGTVVLVEDLGAPPDTLVMSGVESLSTSRTALFNFAVERGEPADEFQCSLDGAPFAVCAASYELTGLDDGPHTLQVYAVRNGTPDGTPEEVTWTIDATPLDTVIVQAPPALTNQDTVTLAFSATGGTDFSEFSCYQDSAPVVGACAAALTSPLQLTGLSDGTYTLYVRARDLAGNYDPTPAVFTWTIDTEAPDTAVSGPEMAQVGGQIQLDLSPYVWLPTPAGYECAVDGAGYAPCSDPLVLPAGALGAHTVSVRALDAATNVDPTPAVHSWKTYTPLPATVTQDTTLAASASPYLVPAGGLQVAQGTTLTFEAGTEIGYDSSVQVYANIEVYGTLNVVGTSANPVLLDGISIDGGGSIVIDYATIQGGAPLAGYHCTGPVFFSLKHSTLTQGFVDPFCVDDFVIEENLFLSSYTIGTRYENSGSIRYNTFVDGLGAAISIGGSSTVTVKYNSFMDTDQIAIELKYGGMPLDATQNYFGTTDTAAIEANQIYDYDDDVTQGQLVFTPVLGAPDPLAPTP